MAPLTPRSTHRHLRGREDVVSRVTRLLSDLERGTGGALLVLGPPGSGRTTVLDVALERADVTVRTVRVHGAPPDQAWGLALVADVAHRLRAVTPRLPPSLRAVLDAVVGDLAPPGPGPVAAAFTALLAEAAADEPLALVIDDVDELDPDSRAVLATAIRRLVDDPVAIVMTGVHASELRGAVHVELAPLTAEDAAAVVQDAATGPVSPLVRQEICALADGRPAVLVELIRALTADQVAGRRPLPEPLPVGPLLEKGALDRFEDLSPESLRPYVLLAVAGDLPVDLLRSPAFAAPDWPDRAEIEGSLVIEGGRARLADRLAGSALVHRLDPPERRRAHLAVAALFPDDDPLRAWHRAAAVDGHDDGLADLLADEAERARRRGALVASARWWTRSATLTTDVELRAGRSLEAVRSHLDAGHPGPLEALLEPVATARGLLAPGPAADLIDLELARVEARLLLQRGRLDDAVELLRTASADLVSTDDATNVAALLDAVPTMLRAARSDLVEDLLTSAASALDRANPIADGLRADLEGHRFRLAEAALSVARGGPEAEPVLLDEAAALLRHDAAALAYVAECAGLALIWSERYPQAASLLDGLEQRARAAAAPVPLATVRALQAQAAMRQGRLHEAAAAAGEAARVSDEIEATGVAPFAHAVLAAVEAQRGDAAGCRSSSEWLLRRAVVTGDPRWEVPARAALGLLALGEGRPDDAVQEMRPLLGRPRTSPWMVMWEGDLIEALIRSGRRDEAEALLVGLDERPAWATGRAGAVKERLLGLLSTDVDVALAHLTRAAASSGGSGIAFGRARARLAEGQLLRRSRRRREARIALEDAWRTFSAMGADPWTRTAAAEVAACGAPSANHTSAPGPEEVLTPQEMQVATLVADGASNREVADQLFISVRTVESHLGRIYRKLGVRSRSSLAARRSAFLDPDGPLDG